jgi:hypothetical protein
MFIYDKPAKWPITKYTPTANHMTLQEGMVIQGI